MTTVNSLVLRRLAVVLEGDNQSKATAALCVALAYQAVIADLPLAEVIEALTEIHKRATEVERIKADVEQLKRGEVSS